MWEAEKTSININIMPNTLYVNLIQNLFIKSVVLGKVSSDETFYLLFGGNVWKNYQFEFSNAAVAPILRYSDMVSSIRQIKTLKTVLQLFNYLANLIRKLKLLMLESWKAFFICLKEAVGKKNIPNANEIKTLKIWTHEELYSLKSLDRYWSFWCFGRHNGMMKVGNIVK